MTKKIILFITIAMIVMTMGMASVSGAPPLKITAPGNINQEATGINTIVNLGIPKPSGGDPPYNTTNDAPPGGFKIGDTTITWTVEDNASAIAIATQLVTITHKNPPIITVTGTNPIIINVGDKYNDAGATATDTVDGDVTTKIVTDNPINENIAGTYTVTYDVSDSAGNPAQQKTRTVKVENVSTIDNIPPIITVLGTNPKTINVGDTYNDAGAIATDNIDGDITAKIVTDNPVNANIAGTYTVTYDVSDNAGNPAQQKKRTVKVVENVSNIDNIPPIITVLGTNPILINVGDKYNDAGATATDNVDGNITAKIVTDNPVNANIAGTYTVTYDVSDSAGNPAQQKTRTVKVIALGIDKIPPTITAPADITIQATGGLTHVTLGIPTVADNIDPNPTVTNNAPAGSNFPLGTTTVTWTVTDSSGNSNTSTQLVTVTMTPVVPVKLAIVNYTPASLIVVDTAPSTTKFSITTNQAANVVWNLDGVYTPGGQSVTEDTHSINIPVIGSSHVLTVTVQNGTDSDSKTWNLDVKGTLEASAKPSNISIGQSTNVTIKVDRRCGIEKGDNCTASKRIPVSGATVSLTGIATASGSVNDTTGEFITTINATDNGTINVTVNKSGYVDGYTNITVGTIVPTPSPTSPPSGGSGGGNSGSGGGGGGGSSSGGGGGGGGGGTAEPYDNVLKYEIQEHNVFTTPVSFKYATPELGVYEVLVTSTQSDIAALRIEVLKGTSKLVGMPAPGIVYKNLNAWIDYKRIKNATMMFRVENSWIDNNRLLDGNIKLNRWDNTSKRWIELLTSVKNKDGQYTYLEAQTDNFSSFAISARPSSSATTNSATSTEPNTADTIPVPIDAGMTKSNNYRLLEIGVVAIVVVLIFYMLRIKKQ